MRIVVALGGNALLRRGEPMTPEAQHTNVRVAAQALADLAHDHQIIVAHGNGPQVGLMALQAAAYAPHNIRVNLLAPGLTATPMSLRAQSNPVIQEFITRKQPLDGGRMGRPNDLDAAVIWLLSEGSRFVTGQVIAVDGGWSVSDAFPSQGLSPQSGSAPLAP